MRSSASSSARGEDVGVALDHRRHVTVTPQRFLIQGPHGVRHRLIVRIDEVVAVAFMPGEMNLLYALARNAVEISERIELMIHAAHVDVVHVEQDQTVGLARDGGEEFPLRHARVVKSEIAGDVLQQNASPENFLYRAHTRDDMRQRFFGVRQRQRDRAGSFRSHRSSRGDRRSTPAAHDSPAPSPVRR